ncbi:ankyrin repeat domain-containing protein [Thermodesulfobacteriota bacterium]
MVKKVICILVLMVCLGIGVAKAAPPIMSLNEAAFKGDIDMIRQHIKAGSDLNEKDPMSGSCPLITAAVFGKIEVARELIKAGADINGTNNEGSTPLITAAAFGQTEVARELIKAGADVNSTNNEGSTALITAAVLCRTEIVEVLLKNGADKNVKNKAGSTALDAVTVPFDKVKGTYDYLGTMIFEPLGLKLDYERIKTTRPRIAQMLR